MKPIVEQGICISCGTCAALCGDVFHMNSENKAEVIEGVDYDKYKDSIQEAANSCPVQAITIEE